MGWSIASDTAPRGVRLQPRSPAPSLVRVLVVLLVLSLLATGALAGQPAALAFIDEPPPGLSVLRTPDGTWEVSQPNLVLKAGASIKTGVEPATLRLAGGTLVQVEPHSRVRVQEQADVMAERGARRASRIDLSEGQISAHVQRGALALLVVHSGEILGVITQGTMRAKVVPTGMLMVIEQGTGTVASHGRWVNLTSGQYMALGEPRATPRALASAPAFIPSLCTSSPGHPCALAVTHEWQKARVGVRWTTVAEATRYLVRIARDERMLQVVQENAVQKSAYVSEPLSAGRYWVTVQAVDAHGIPGLSTPPRRLRIEQVVVEDGGYFSVSDAVAVVRPRKGVSFRHPEELEMSIADQPFGPVPRRLALGTMSPRLEVRVRARDNPLDEVRLRFERSALRADIEFTPVHAAWPRDPVSVSIRLVDPGGRIRLDDFDARIAIRINDADVHDPGAFLSRNGASWQGRIEPWAGPGPWVIRVEVKDKAGFTLGRNFIEVGNPKKARSR